MIGVIGALEKEVALLRELMSDAKTSSSGGFEFHSGKIEGKDVVVLLCGVGKVNAAVGCSLLLQLFKPELVVNTGSAGGIASGLNFGDVVVSSGLLYHDVDVTAFNYAPGQLPKLPQVFSVDEDLIVRAEDAVDRLKAEKVLPESFNHLRGVIGSGDSFMCRREDIERIKKTFPEVAAVEMEGAAIAHCCRLFGTRFLVIRALSDIAGEESPVTFDEFLPIASKHSAHIVVRIIRNS
ncbi:MAG: 5'-methylthioadenosine/adenosylhomocysteine nucleosidase [Treponema sp.]|nr:5'-methylthioadenosine/adenosylhomocysteine nucleosidase [Treponema sp.]